MESIIDPGSDRCFLCDSKQFLEEHHIFNGALRTKSEQYGLKVRLCADCHRHSRRSAHQCKETKRYLQRIAQIAAMTFYEWDVAQFVAKFYRNYLNQGEDTP